MPLVGFTGNTADSLGIVSLLMAVGNNPRRVDKMVHFLVVDIPSAYNAIIGATNAQYYLGNHIYFPPLK